MKSWKLNEESFYSLLDVVTPEERTLSVMLTHVLPTRVATQRPAARVARDHVTPHQAGAADQAHGLEVVVGAHTGGGVHEDGLPRPDVLRGPQQPPAPLLVLDLVLGTCILGSGQGQFQCCGDGGGQVPITLTFRYFNIIFMVICFKTYITGTDRF